MEGRQNFVAHLLKARTVEADKQPLLGNGPYTRSGGTDYIHCDVTRSLWIQAALVAM
jgi:hypothetical protein